MTPHRRDTSYSRSRTLEGRFKLARNPAKALNLELYTTSRTKKYTDTVTVLCAWHGGPY